MPNTPEEGVKMALVSAERDCFSASWGLQFWFGMWKPCLQNVSYFRNKTSKEMRYKDLFGGNSYRWRIAAPA